MTHQPRTGQPKMKGIISVVFKKVLAAIISALIGLVLIPILSLEFSLEWLPLLIAYFLPGFSIGLLILFELLTRIRILQKVYSFIQDFRMVIFSVLYFTNLRMDDNVES